MQKQDYYFIFLSVSAGFLCIFFKWLILQNSLISCSGAFSLTFCQVLPYAAWHDSELNSRPGAYGGAEVMEKAAPGSPGVTGAVGSAGSIVVCCPRPPAVPVGCEMHEGRWLNVWFPEHAHSLFPELKYGLGNTAWVTLCICIFSMHFHLIKRCFV